MKKIVFTGPESTGKSTLCKQVSAYFNFPFVDEYARIFLNNLDRIYTQSDLVDIAKGQIELENKVVLSKTKILFCDTDLLTIKIWSEYKYGICNNWIVETLKNNPPDMYLLCTPDIEWEKDTQRESENNRVELFEIYKKEIIELGVNFEIITGIGSKRLDNCISLID